MRVLVLMHRENVPPDGFSELPESERKLFKTEADVLAALAAAKYEVHVLGVEDELGPIREAVTRLEPDVVFNLLVDFHGVALYDAHIVSYLELLKVPYTGCNPRGILLASDKELSKKVLHYHRIRVPHFALFERGRKVRRPPKLEFPLFVKSSTEHSSAGIAQASVVHDDAALAERVAFVHETVGTAVLAEQYIEGRELTIGVLGNRRLTTFPIWEMTFGNLPRGAEPIATSRAKFDLAYQEKLGIEIGPAQGLSDDQRGAIARLAKRAYRVLGMSGFARIDLRMDHEGRVFVLEANPNPDLARGEDLAEAASAAGVDYNTLIRRIVSLGVRYRAGWKAG